MIVGIGASAGGLEAFTQLLKHLPLDTGMGYVLVQHFDPEHDSALPHILSRATSLPVHEIAHDQPVQANHVYVIPRDTTLTIVQGVLKLEPRVRTRTPPRPIDTFFESLARDQREQAIGVVLSGTASDGTLGLEAIKAEGGFTFAQDDSAKHDSMPRSAVAAGVVDFVLSPADIANELARIAQHPSSVDGERPARPEADRAQATAHEDDDTALPSGGKGSPRSGATQARAEAARAEGTGAESQAAKQTEDGYKNILTLLRNHSGVDFMLYRSATIQRRITRRLILNKQERLEDYARFLRGNVNELNALYSDVLVGVTSFFRNPEMFDALQRDVFPKLLNTPGDTPIRIWVLGCSTGQEAYSLTIAFVEAAEKASRRRTLQVFATDLNDALLDKARHGLYAKTLAADLTPQRLQRFFHEEDGGYRINKSLREQVVFARQNLFADPPFSRMDLVSCRNLLIYLEPSLQQKALPTFHYALNPHGYLLLDASETISGFSDLFEPVDTTHNIYSKKATPTRAFHLPVRKEVDARRSPGRRPSALPPLGSSQGGALQGFHGELYAQREADRIILKRFTPPGVLVNADLHVLQFRGMTGAYLEPPSGKASFDVLKMARSDLMLALRAAINHAKKDNKTVRREDIPLTQDGETRMVNVEVIPLTNVRERCFLILFEEVKQIGRGRVPSRGPVAARTARSLSTTEASSLVADSQGELADTRDYLRSIEEQYEAATEELQVANEEIQSANEELQSTNEELETSKEELESTNEELTTVNEEMSSRNVELNRLNQDLTDVQQALQRLNADLEQRVAERTHELEQSRNQLRTLTTELNLAEQRERTRLATELHDYLAQLLVLCRFTLGHARRAELPPHVEGFVKEAEDVLDQALTYCRTLMAELSPPVLQEGGLPAGLLWLGDHMKRQGLVVHVESIDARDAALPANCAVLLFQSVRELLINVAKHGAVKTATVRMTSEGGSLRIVVRDEGGFTLAAAAADRNVLPLSSKFGLFSIRERMAGLGGSFDIRSAPGQGTTATLMLPHGGAQARGPGVSQQASASTGQEKAADVPLDARPWPEATPGIRVLLVDDHTVLRQGLRSIVTAYNHLEVVGEAADGVEAVELAARLYPDVVVMDINMPRMNGIEATRRIRAHQPHIAVIGLSVNQSADVQQKMLVAGAAAYLTKESAVDVLCHTIEQVVSEQRATMVRQRENR